MTNRPATIDRLHDAIALIAGDARNRVRPEETMATLVDLGARLTLRPCGNHLRYCGASASCTWSADAGLIKAWHAAALRRIAKLKFGDRA